MKKKKDILKNNLLKIFLIFLLFSFLGSLIEFIVSKDHAYFDAFVLEYINIKIPFMAMYGIVAVVLFLLEKYVYGKKLNIFFRGLLNGLIIIFSELIVGLFSFFVLNKIYWNYAGINFMGIISLKVSLLWIISGYIFTIIYNKFIKKIKFS